MLTEKGLKYGSRGTTKRQILRDIRHPTPLKSGRSKYFSNWENLGMGLAFSKHHHILNSQYFLSILAGFCLAEQN